MKDLEAEIQSLKKRLSDQENANQLQGEEIEQYEENRLNYEKSRKSQEKVIADHEKRRVAQEEVIAEYERIRTAHKRENNGLKQENKTLRADLERTMEAKTKM